MDKNKVNIPLSPSLRRSRSKQSCAESKDVLDLNKVGDVAAVGEQPREFIYKYKIQ